jgi:hypothetical protein
LRDEAAGGQVMDQRSVHLFVEVEIESIERPIRVTEARLFVPGARGDGPWRRRSSSDTSIERMRQAGRVIDATSVITKRYTLAESRQAVQDTADRTIITGVIEFT